MSSLSSLFAHWHYHAGKGLGLFVPMKRSVNAAAYEDILDSCRVLTLWQQFGKEPQICVMVSIHKFLIV